MAEHTDLKTLGWDRDEDGVYLDGKLKLSGADVIVAMHLAEVDAKAIVLACNSYHKDQKVIEDLVNACKTVAPALNELLTALKEERIEPENPEVIAKSAGSMFMVFGLQ
jgi:hydroxypyruvate isomerase